jgi:hypothetical protein
MGDEIPREVMKEELSVSMLAVSLYERLLYPISIRENGE